MTAATRGKKLATDEIIEALIDPRVQEVLSNIITKLNAENFSKIIQENLLSITSSLTVLQDENAKIKDSHDQLKNQNLLLVSANSKLQKQVDDLSAYSRRENVIIHGLPTSSYSDIPLTQGHISSLGEATPDLSNASTVNAVIDLVRNSLGISVDVSDISVAHRLKVSPSGATSRASTSARMSPPPVIVRFVRREIRDSIYSARKNLKAARPGVYINEHLSPSNATIFAKARSLVKTKKIHAAFTSNG